MRRRAGQALVEFALVVPLFLLLVLGVIEGGRLVFTYHEVSAAAKEGARYAAAHGCKAATPVATAAAVEEHILAVTPGLEAGALTVSAQWTADGGVPPEPYDPNCQGQANRPGALVVVEVRYAYQPLVGMVFGTGPLTLTGQSELRVHF